MFFCNFYDLFHWRNITVQMHRQNTLCSFSDCFFDLRRIHSKCCINVDIHWRCPCVNNRSCSRFVCVRNRYDFITTPNSESSQRKLQRRCSRVSSDAIPCANIFSECWFETVGVRDIVATRNYRCCSWLMKTIP